MTTDNFAKAARAYAEQACYQDENIPIAEAGFRAGWEAARTHLAAQEPTDAEVEAGARAAWDAQELDYSWEEANHIEKNETRFIARATLTAARRDGDQR